MAFVVNYQSTHDLYHYNSGPTIDPTNYANNVEVNGVSYNTNLYIKNPIYGLPEIDFSGLALRPRGAPSYGFDQFNGHLASGITINPINGNVSFPDIVEGYFFSQRPESDSGLTCYYPGCPTGNFTKASDFNYWNDGIPAKVLISPKHFIATQHFVGSGSVATVSFIGKNNQIYTKSAVKVVDLRLGPIPDGYDWPKGYDICVFEFTDKFTDAELEQIKIYKFLNLYGIPKNVPAFHVLSQGQVVVKVAAEATPEPVYYGFTHYFNYADYPNAAYIGYKTPSGSSIIDATTVWVGDSGTPVLVNVPRTGETCLLGLYYGGYGIYDDGERPKTVSRQFFDALQSYIYDNTDPNYRIQLVQYNSTTPPTPYPAPYPPSLYLNGNTYQLQFLAKPTSNRGSTASLFASLPPGNTYSFAIVAYNNNGISTATTLNNVYFPA